MMDLTPFPEEHQLNGELHIDQRRVPANLRCVDVHTTTLPGQPRVQLDSASISTYLEENLWVTELDRLAPKLWLVATPRSSHISPLHHQAVRGRNIVQTENPQLHLVWYYDRIFIKPIPRYLLSFAFWQHLGAEPAATRKAAIGFMRSYSHLIQYESDFSLALEKGLIPRRSSCGPSTATGKDEITFESFVRLITSFDRFDDAFVSPRYSYGELRLTRLNFYSRIFLGKLTFHHINAQWGTFINGAITPFVVVFAILAIVLNAMQVELAVLGYNDLSSSWAVFANASKWAAVIVLVFVLLTMGLIVVLVLFMFFHDIWFAQSILRDKKNQTHATAWATRKSGVVWWPRIKPTQSFDYHEGLWHIAAVIVVSQGTFTISSARSNVYQSECEAVETLSSALEDNIQARNGAQCADAKALHPTGRFIQEQRIISTWAGDHDMRSN